MKSIGIAFAVLAIAFLPAAQAQLPSPAQESQQSETSANPLIGIWASETTFGPTLHGELTLARVGSRWRGTVAPRCFLLHHTECETPYCAASLSPALSALAC